MLFFIMRLTFSSSNYRNADLKDERGHVLNTIHTTSPLCKTTIERHAQGIFGGLETVSIVDWHVFRSTKVHLGGQTFKADDLLTKRWFSRFVPFLVVLSANVVVCKVTAISWDQMVANTSGNFTHPVATAPYVVQLLLPADAQTTAYLQLQPADAQTELVKYHRGSFGVLSPSHPYLDISASVTRMLDHIITTFIHIEHLNEHVHNTRAAASG